MKESEWIVSPEKLKENQELVIEKELLEKEEKKDKLISRICTLIIIATLVVLAFGLNKMTDKAIDNCIDAGNSENFCKTELTK